MPPTTTTLTLVPPSPITEGVDTRTDDELMLLTRAGKLAAFDVLVLRHQAKVLRTAARYLGDVSMAPDVAQRAFVELFRSSEQYRPSGKLWPYLSRIVVNQCRMTARSEKRHRPPWLAEDERVSDDMSGLLAREQRRELQRAVDGLSAKLREVVVLRYVSGLTLEEISDALGVPIGTVKSRLFTAMDKLRSAMGGEP